jgi:DsbC/DsbD-like thiol-disulfide interchange protein
MKVRNDRKTGRTMRQLWVIAIVFLLHAVGDAPAHAGDEVQASHSSARLFVSHEQVTPGESFWAVLHIRQKPGWHSYWQNPGDSGMATTIEWQNAPDVKTGPIHWPIPDRIEVAGLVSFGYSDDAYHLIPITVSKAVELGQEVTLHATVNWLTCDETCIPQSADLTLDFLVSESAKPSYEIDKVDALLKRVPIMEGIAEAYIAPQREGQLRLVAVLDDRSQWADARWRYYPLGNGVVNIKQPYQWSNDGAHVFADIQPGTVALGEALHGVLVAQTPAEVKAFQFAATSVEGLPQHVRDVSAPECEGGCVSFLPLCEPCSLRCSAG